MTFSQAYTLYGPDVERIARRLGIAPHEADRRINAEMNKRHKERTAGDREARRKEYRRDYNLRIRDQLRKIRAGMVA